MPAESLVVPGRSASGHGFVATAIAIAIAIAIATLLASPSVSSASRLTNTFVRSPTGTPAVGTGDTIQFEVTILADAGVNYDTLIFSLTGDAVGAIGSSFSRGWEGVANRVINWEWHYTPAGGGRVDMGTNGRFTPLAPALPIPGRVSGGYGFPGVGSKTGDGIPAMVGTVTIHVDTVGVFSGGAFQYPGVDGFYGSAGGGEVPFVGGEFSNVGGVPEPGSALLLAAGLASLGGWRRRTRAQR